jgi:D-alanine transaminase
MKTVYINGEYLPLTEAKVSVLDRGFLFADGVYEVVPVYGGRPFRLEQHLDRLDNSLAGIRIANPLSREQWREIVTKLIADNGGQEQLLYWQVTRGSAPVRDHLFNGTDKPTVLAMSSKLKSPSAEIRQSGASLITLDDVRWRYCHLKTIALLPNVLMRQQAFDGGYDEAILIRDGFATECTTANIFIVENGIIVTPPKGEELLPGITRDLVLELAQSHGMPWAEEKIELARLRAAEEIWLSSSTREVVAVTRLDGKKVGDGRPGPLLKQMSVCFQEYKDKLIRGEAS